MIKEEINQYLNWKASYTKSAANRYALHLYRLDKFCHKPLRDITVIDIVNFRNNLNLKYSPANVNYAMIIIKDFLGYYRKQGLIDIDPSLIRIKKVLTRSHYAITEEEYKKMLSVLRDDELWNVQKKIVIRLLWETGVRVSELCALNISDMNSAEPRALIVTKKGNREGWIFWSQETHQLVLKFLGVRLCTNQRPHLFMTEKGHNRPTTRTVERWISDTCTRSGIPKKITPHSFRHGKAHHIINQGGNVKDVQVLLRHSETNPIAAFSYLRMNSMEIEKRASLFL